MKRYQNIRSNKTLDISIPVGFTPSVDDNINQPSENKTRYLTVKYPEIPLDISDIYVYITRGDRYDLLASSYYGDSSLWWVIAKANPSQNFDSLTPNIGSQIRIPGPQRISNIIGEYENINTI